MPNQTVLIATDLSARCDRPFDRAVMLGKAWHSLPIVLHIRTKVASDDEDDAAFAERIVRDMPIASDEMELVLGEGSPPDEVARIAAEMMVDLIVTGVARYNHAKDYYLGTAVDRIVRAATRPVLIVKKRPLAAYRTILVMTDLSRCSLDALVTAAALFPDAMIHLVHVFHVPFEAWLKSEDVHVYVRDEAQAGLETFLCSPECTADIRARLDVSLEEGELGGVTAAQINYLDADLVVSGTHGRSLLTHATIGSNAESLLSWVPVDVLMVREHRR